LVSVVDSSTKTSYYQLVDGGIFLLLGGAKMTNDNRLLSLWKTHFAGWLQDGETLIGAAERLDNMRACGLNSFDLGLSLADRAFPEPGMYQDYLVDRVYLAQSMFLFQHWEEGKSTIGRLGAGRAYKIWKDYHSAIGNWLEYCA
jgi:hypothetical protein